MIQRNIAKIKKIFRKSARNSFFEINQDAFPEIHDIYRACASRKYHSARVGCQWWGVCFLAEQARHGFVGRHGLRDEFPEAVSPLGPVVRATVM
jgi:hypothetical protein